MLDKTRRIIVNALAFIFVALVLAHVARSQTTTQLEVTRNVNLRPAPTTSNIPIELIRPPEKLTLIEPDKTNGYYHVRVGEGEEGWVWAKNVKLIPASVEPETPVGPATTPAAPAATILSTWTKGTPNKLAFYGNEGICPYDGNGFDPDQFTLKNRSDLPDSYYDVTWEAIDALPFPGRTDHHYAPPHRKDWTQSQLDVIEPYESIPVRVIGYVVAIKPQNGGSGEGTNCKFNKVGDVDTHIAIVAKVGDGEAKSIVIEWTPRFLKDHPNWTRAKLLPWLDTDKPVRVSGWLMVDPDHVNHLGKYRNTLWEIHPITRFEVFKDGEFVDMDDLP